MSGTSYPCGPVIVSLTKVTRCLEWGSRGRGAEASKPRAEGFRELVTYVTLYKCLKYSGIWPSSGLSPSKFCYSEPLEKEGGDLPTFFPFL